MFINRLEVETVAVALLIVEQGGILNNYIVPIEFDDSLCSFYSNFCRLMVYLVAIRLELLKMMHVNPIDFTRPVLSTMLL